MTALFAVFFVILAFWISFTGLSFVCLISWVDKLVLKATVEPRFHPCAIAQRCLSSYNCLQQGMSTTFFAFFSFSQSQISYLLRVKILHCHGSESKSTAISFKFTMSCILYSVKTIHLIALSKKSITGFQYFKKSQAVRWAKIILSFKSIFA